MTDTAWKRAERMAAAVLGGVRNPLSGSTSLHTSGDVIHPELYVECKYRARHVVASLMRSTAALARKEGKTPVVVLQERDSKYALIVVRSVDLRKVVDILSAQADPVQVRPLPPLTKANAGMHKLSRRTS